MSARIYGNNRFSSRLFHRERVFPREQVTTNCGGVEDRWGAPGPSYLIVWSALNQAATRRTNASRGTRVQATAARDDGRLDVALFET